MSAECWGKCPVIEGIRRNVDHPNYANILLEEIARGKDCPGTIDATNLACGLYVTVGEPQSMAAEIPQILVAPEAPQPTQ